MPMLKVHPEIHAVIDKLRPYNILHRSAVLYPLHHCRQHVVRAFKGHSLGWSPAALADDPAPWARVAVKHAGDTEEAKEVIQLIRSGLRCAWKEVVESLRVEASDLVVLTAVEEENFAAVFLESSKVVGPGSDVGGIERLGYGGIVDIERGCIPGWIVDNVLEPALKG